MSHFKIISDPELNRHISTVRKDFGDFVSIYEAIDRNNVPNFLIKFLINGREFGYQDYSLVGVIYDILEELRKLKSCISHDIYMCGYAILTAEISDKKILFRDTYKTDWFYICPVDIVINEFDAFANAAFSYASLLK